MSNARNLANLKPTVSGQIESGNIANGAVNTVDLADTAVHTQKLADGAVTVPKISASGTPGPTNFLRGDGQWQVVAVTPTAVSDQQNTSTGAFDLPAGTTAQRPATAFLGYTRLNTDTGSIEVFDGATWNSVTRPFISNITGNIYVGVASTLNISGQNFTSSVSVRFVEAGLTLATVTNVSVSAGVASVTVPSAVFNQTAGDVISIFIVNSDGSVSNNSVNRTVIGLPTGGDTTTYGNFRSHTFLSSGTFTVPSGFSTTADYLIVAGGGGGGQNAGAGGGAGGMLEGSTTISSGSYSIIVGGGGAGGTTSQTETRADNGSNSTALGFTAIGGGGGTNSGGVGGNGGSGGGAGNYEAGNRSGGSGVVGQGNKGGDGTVPGGSGRTGGGGGGAGAEGQASVSTSQAGAGGVGRSNSFRTGSPIFYAGGGGGGVHGGSAGAGGNGGGGNGGGQSGAASTGGGGGAGNSPNAGAAGGSGIVIIRYAL